MVLYTLAMYAKDNDFVAYVKANVIFAYQKNRSVPLCRSDISHIFQ